MIRVQAITTEVTGPNSSPVEPTMNDDTTEPRGASTRRCGRSPPSLRARPTSPSSGRASAGPGSSGCLVFAAIAATDGGIVVEPARTELVADWWATLTPAGLWLTVLLVIGGLLLIAGLAGPGPARRPRAP